MWRHLVNRRFMTAGAIWLAGRADTISALLPKELFYYSIFQRMKGDHSQPPAFSQPIDSLWQNPFQRFQFMVHSHPERLKGSGCRMDAYPRPLA